MLPRHAAFRLVYENGLSSNAFLVIISCPSLGDGIDDYLNFCTPPTSIRYRCM